MSCTGVIVQFFGMAFFQVSFIEDLVHKRSASGPPLLIYASTPAVLALKKTLAETILERVSFVPIKNNSRCLTVREVKLIWIGNHLFFEDFCLQSLGNNAWYMVFTTRPVAESNVMGMAIFLAQSGDDLPHQPVTSHRFLHPKWFWQIVTFEIIWTWWILPVTF